MYDRSAAFAAMLANAEAFAPLKAAGAKLDRDECAPELWAVWLEEDIIGAGATAEDAIADALKTVSQWAEGLEGIGETCCAACSGRD